ncbi:1-acyl-sn-glycerol-3-phosphate acyltransferase [Piscinibacter aquaticus]|uniref:1-acyl-sn-glycerol-3-phosphate acyltransferase n=1 Tax=Piscinibacter aquaticus TaxID=392597 RepID=A0A5C6U528_9BURK|nr:1-acyl-sn-glycerol-3-phosphate acyltransferase [Piscinibacter aquaticus]
MNALRSALFVLWMAVTVVPWAIFVLVYSIFVRGHRLYWFTMMWLRMAIWGARVICGVRHRIQGWENLPDTRIILCPKHQSTWETFAFPTLMPHPLCYVFKRELLMIPFFGWAMGRLDMIHIDRSKRAEAWAKVAEQGRRFMADGHWVIMFPEGTRTPRGSQGTYKNGAARLAVTTDTPLVPIAVTSARCWPRKSFVLRPGVIDISIGKPIPATGREPDELMREVERWVEAEMRRLDPEAYGAPAPVAQPT